MFDFGETAAAVTLVNVGFQVVFQLYFRVTVCALPPFSGYNNRCTE